MKNLLFLIFLICSGTLFGQEGFLPKSKKTNPSLQDSLKMNPSLFKESSSNLLYEKSMDWDWNGSDEILLDEVSIVGPLKFSSREERREYLILKRKTEKVWPYAKLAAERLNSLRDRLETLDSRYDKKVYTQRVQRYMEDQFTDQLKKLTKTEGQILVKLMYRQTGETTYEVIRELRNGWRAFRYNVTAGVFTISLKEGYDPLEVKEDYYIEHILRRAFQRGSIEPQDPAIDIDFLKALQKWENLPVEEGSHN